MMISSLILAAAIVLNGVSGGALRARAFFDANNVKVGDPLVLTIDFLGEADFKALHPPSLSRAVNRKDWKLDDSSAKTETYRDARRLTYRVRPMREGVLYFPSFEFEYADSRGGRRTVRSNEIPVHAKAGAQVVVAGLEEDPNELPKAPDIITDPGVSGLSGDELFSWRRACARPKADLFAAFDFPAAKLNEASCAIREGNWARACKIYERLEWRIGQTPEIERGLLAALALRYDNPAAVLPMWRVVGRPILRHAWKGRVGIVLGGLAAIVLLFWLIGRGIRAVACLALVLFLVCDAPAQGIFDEFERMQRQMRQRMNQMMGGGGGFSFSFGGGEERQQEKPTATLSLEDKAAPQVGGAFNYIVSIESSRTSNLGQINFAPSTDFGMTVVGQIQTLTNGKSANPTNVVRRFAIPVRYDVPYHGSISFVVSGMISGRRTARGGQFTFQFSNSFEARTPPLQLDVKPLPTAGQPKDYAGIVSEGLFLREDLDLHTVESNDVIQITYTLQAKGYVPDDFMPPGSAFEIEREVNRNDHRSRIFYRRFLVADGLKATPKVEVSYFDPRTKTYKRVRVGGTPIKYGIIDK